MRNFHPVLRVLPKRISRSPFMRKNIDLLLGITLLSMSAIMITTGALALSGLLGPIGPLVFGLSMTSIVLGSGGALFLGLPITVMSIGERMFFSKKMRGNKSEPQAFKALENTINKINNEIRADKTSANVLREGNRTMDPHQQHAAAASQASAPSAASAADESKRRSFDKK